MFSQVNMNVESAEPKIRQIEDIIDIQKANGNFHSRQVAFNLPSKTDSTISTSIVKSLESGLSKLKANTNKKKNKKRTKKRSKNPSSEVVSWPSDSDITVLRMKLFLTQDLNEEVENKIPGDGLHQPDSSSMINLATLMLQSRSPSKHSLNFEEYLLPISSWGKETMQLDRKDTKEMKTHLNFDPTCFDKNLITCEFMSSNRGAKNVYLSDPEESNPETNIKSKVARFLRLYFCPCCTCLYKLENISQDPSTYFAKNRNHI